MVFQLRANTCTFEVGQGTLGRQCLSLLWFLRLHHVIDCALCRAGGPQLRAVNVPTSVWNDSRVELKDARADFHVLWGKVRSLCLYEALRWIVLRGGHIVKSGARPYFLTRSCPAQAIRMLVPFGHISPHWCLCAVHMMRGTCVCLLRCA